MLALLWAVLGALCQVYIGHLLILILFLLIFILSITPSSLATEADFGLIVRELNIGLGDMVPISHLGLHGTLRERTLDGLLLLPRYQPTHRGRPFSHFHGWGRGSWGLCNLLDVPLDGLELAALDGFPIAKQAAEAKEEGPRHAHGRNQGVNDSP